MVNTINWSSGRWGRAPGFDAIASDGGEMRRGQAGEEVVALQKMLNSMNAGIEVDGMFGAETEAALMDFQDKVGAKEYGRVGSETLGKLRELAPRFDAPAPEGSVPASRLAADDQARRNVRRLHKDGAFDGARDVKLTRGSDGRPAVLSYKANMAIDSDGAPNVLGMKEKRALGLSNKGMERHAAELTAEARADGSDTRYWFDPDKRSDTSLSYRVKGRETFVDADKVPFIVLPPSLAAKSGARKGDLAMVRYGDKSVYAIFADTGPKRKLGEASMATARALGLDPNPRSGGLDERFQDVEYTVLPGTGAALRARPHTFEEIQSLGEIAFGRAARLGLLDP